MTRPGQYSAVGDIVKLLADDGFDVLGEVISRRRFSSQVLKIIEQ